MTRQFVILDSAKEEFRDIKKYVKKDFGDLVWAEVNTEYKQAFQLIRNHPELGSPIDELKEIGIGNIKCRLIRQTRIIYEFDDGLILIHMFIATRRDFRTHLMKRLFRAS